MLYNERHQCLKEQWEAWDVLMHHLNIAKENTQKVNLSGPLVLEELYNRDTLKIEEQFCFLEVLKANGIQAFYSHELDRVIYGDNLQFFYRRINFDFSNHEEVTRTKLIRLVPLLNELYSSSSEACRMLDEATATESIKVVFLPKGHTRFGGSWDIHSRIITLSGECDSKEEIKDLFFTLTFELCNAANGGIREVLLNMTSFPTAADYSDAVEIAEHKSLHRKNELLKIIFNKNVALIERIFEVSIESVLQEIEQSDIPVESYLQSNDPEILAHRSQYESCYKLAKAMEEVDKLKHTLCENIDTTCLSIKNIKTKQDIELFESELRSHIEIFEKHLIGYVSHIKAITLKCKEEVADKEIVNNFLKILHDTIYESLKLPYLTVGEHLEMAREMLRTIKNPMVSPKYSCGTQTDSWEYTLNKGVYYRHERTYFDNSCMIFLGWTNQFDKFAYQCGDRQITGLTAQEYSDRLRGYYQLSTQAGNLDPQQDNAVGCEENVSLKSSRMIKFS